MIKLNTIVQKYIIRIDTIISEELFNEFKKARSIDEKRSLERKLQEAQSKAAEMEPSQIPYLSASPQGLLDTLKDKKKPSPVPYAAEIQVYTKTPTVEPMSNVVEMEVEKTLIAGLILPIVEHVQIDVNEGKQSVTERKEKTRTLVWNVRAKNDRKQNLDPRFEYGRPKKKR
ncbi:hypothetical protein EV1_043489 [Malus domestica]